MSQDLYFIAILAQALRESDLRRALKRAFEVIEQRGHEAGYEEGYRNFSAFMSEVAARRQLLEEHDMQLAVLEYATGTPDEVQPWEAFVSAVIARGGELKDDLDALLQASRPRSRALNLQLFRDGQQMGEVSFGRMLGRRTIDGVTPGYYVLRLDTGLVLWEGTLAAANLFWTEAFKGESLALAAEAGEIRRSPSREVKVPDAHLILRLRPGIETGSLEIELTP
jgi:hypothetical protein